MGEHPNISEDAARADLLQLILGFQASQAIHAAAALGIADLLISGRKHIADLALATGTHPDSLYRLMRALASIRVFHEDEERSFSLTAVGHFLRSDVADSCAPMAELMGRPSGWQAWGDLLYAVRTRVSAFNHVHGRGVWEHRALHPEEGEVFDRAMAVRTEQFAVAVAEGMRLRPVRACCRCRGRRRDTPCQDRRGPPANSCHALRPAAGRSTRSTISCVARALEPLSSGRWRLLRQRP